MHSGLAQGGTVMSSAATMRALMATILLASGCGPSTSPAVPRPAPEPLRNPMPAAELDTYRACERDDDCMWITNGCCDCANGGVEVAIARARKATFESRFACGGTPCTSRGREIDCGAGSVACESNLCVFHPSTTHLQR